MKFVTVIFVVLFLFGCATAPTVPFQPESGQRVGLVNLVEGQLTHVHVGTTVFNNSEVMHDPAGFNVPEYINQRVIERLQSHGLEVILLNQEALPSHDGPSLLHAGWSGLDVRNTHREPLQRLMNEHRLDLLVVFETTRLVDQIGGSTVHYGGYGLYTRSMLNLRISKAYSNVRGYGISPDPLRLVSWQGPNEDIEVDFRAIDDETIVELEQKIRQLTDAVIARAMAGMGLN